MKAKKLLASLILGVTLPFFIFVSIIEMAVSDKHFYMYQMDKNDVIENTEIYPPDVDSVISEIIAYLNDDRDSFDILARVAPPDAKNVTELTHLFNDKEITHMTDVKNLYQNVLSIRDFSIILILFSFLYLLKIDQKQIIYSLFGGSVFYILLLGLIGIFFAVDFQNSFIKFHQLFFSNELWVMDPATDLLISIVPEPFFIALIRRIIVNISVFLSGLACITGILLYKIKIRGKHENTQH
ncbi:TIGR01906 family membrane protein [Eubacteriaceae bacterium ES2]|nr:TIGR01906 family membrane protein [Eubacteriaceae bacterium ES2]